MSIPRASIRRPVAVTMLCIAIAFLGVISLVRLPVDLLPNVAYPKLIVYSSYPNASPDEVERFVTRRIEAQLAAVPGKERMESLSRAGVSLIVLNFAWGTNMEFAMLNVRERLDNVNGLPTGVDAVVLRTDPRSEPILSLSVAGAGNLWDLKTLSESVFRRRLEQIDGIAQATVTGGLEREIRVEVDLEKMLSYGLTPQHIGSALAAANVPLGGGGRIYDGQFQYSLRTLGEFQSIDEIRNVTISRPTPGGGAPFRIALREIAEIVDGFEDRESIARYNGQESVGLLVFKEASANTVNVTREVETVLDQLRSEYPEVTLDVATSQAGFISSALWNVGQAMVLGAILAFFVLVLFLRDARYPLAISVAIPFSVIATFALFDLAGVSLNIMSLGGLALGIGMLVDNSIVVIENVFRHREKGLTAAAAAAVATEEVQRAITAATLTTIAVFGPIVYVQGVAGELFAALSFAVAFSLLASLMVAITLLPTMAARWESRDLSEIRNPIARGFMRGMNAFVDSPPFRAFDRAWLRVAAAYERALASALRHRGAVVLGAVVLVAAAVPFALDLERSVLPQVDQGEFRAIIQLPLGTPLGTTSQMAAGLERALLADTAVQAVFSRIGKQTAEAGVEEDVSGVNTAILEVRLKPGELTPPVLARLQPQLGTFPEGSLAIETGHATALGKLLGAGEADLAVRIHADEIDPALLFARQVAGRLGQEPSLSNVRVGTELGEPEYVAMINRDRAASLGVQERAVADAIETYMRGSVATEYVDFDRKVPIMVRLPEGDARSLSTLEQLQVNNVPIKQLIDINHSVGLVEIERLDQRRIVPVYADVASGGIDEAATTIRTAVATLSNPENIRIDVGGENEEMRRGFRDLGFAFLLAILLVYMILAAEFESLIHPFTILLSVPLGVVGAVMGLWLFGAGLNTISLIGIVILVGIVDNDAVVKIDLINQFRRQGMTVREAVVAAGHARLRPIVMTSVTTMLAVAPLMIGIGAGAGLQAPLAIAVFFGLFSSTVLTLLVIPVVYELVEEARVWIAGQFGSTVRAPGAAPDMGVEAAIAAEATTTRPARTPEPAAGD